MTSEEGKGRIGQLSCSKMAVSTNWGGRFCVGVLIRRALVFLGLYWGYDFGQLAV